MNSEEVLRLISSMWDECTRTRGMLMQAESRVSALERAMKDTIRERDDASDEASAFLTECEALRSQLKTIEQEHNELKIKSANK